MCLPSRLASTAYGQDASHACTHTLLQGATVTAWCDMRHDSVLNTSSTVGNRLSMDVKDIQGSHL
jgi:hypothetical protein